ncbi:Na+/H+ antiporter NhaA [Candidatus Nanopelagicaceae bacterium]
MLNHLLTFAIFLIIGVEIRDGLAHAKAAILPSLAALGGMIFPAIIFISIAAEKTAWAVVMPTDVALAIGALSLLGSRVNPAVKLFLMTLAVADDFFSLLVIAIFYRSDLDISSAFYTIGAALIGALLPYRNLIMKYLAPVVTFAVIPTYIWINLFSVIELSTFASGTSLSILIARILGKVIGITLTTALLIRWSSLKLPQNLHLKEVAGVGLLSGMGMTVSLVIAEITITDSGVLSGIRSGLFLAAITSGLLGVLWLRRFPVAQ